MTTGGGSVIRSGLGVIRQVWVNLGGRISVQREIPGSATTADWERIVWPGIVHLAIQVACGWSNDVPDHVRVPRELGLQAAGEQHDCDIFQRALLVDILTDCNDLVGDQLTPLVELELDYLLSQRRDDHRGWSYLPSVPEFPPDADTFSSVTLALLGAGHRLDVEKYCDPAIEFALQNCVSPSGVMHTWLVPNNERDIDGRLPEPWTVCLWDGPGSADVFSSLLYALYVYCPDRFANEIAHGLDYLEQIQREDGAWTSPYYCGRFYALHTCMRLFAAARPGSLAVTSALELLRTTQQRDGGWGRRSTGSDPLSTSFALLALAAAQQSLNDDDFSRSAHAAEYLARASGRNNLWPACSFYWVLDEIGKPPTMTPYASATVTSAFVVKAGIAWRRLYAEAGAAQGVGGCR
jgi:squalene-hopene cyclase-like protein